jgi:hypothetical protein
MLRSILGRVNGVLKTLDLGDGGSFPLCSSIATNNAAGWNETWIHVVVEQTTLDPQDLLATEARISPADLAANNGNIPKTIASKLVGNQAFISGLEQVVFGPGPAASTECDLHESPHPGNFQLGVFGYTQSGGLPMTADDDTHYTVCFDPSAGVALEVLVG